MTLLLLDFTNIANQYLKLFFQFGNVANFVETEQLVEHDDVMTSFIQTRGNDTQPFFLPIPLIF